MGTGCDGCNNGCARRPTETLDRSPAPQPVGVEVEVHVVGGGGELARIKQLFTDPVANAALPEDLTSFVRSYVEFPGGVAGALRNDLNAVFLTGAHVNPNRIDDVTSLQAVAFQVRRERGVAYPFGEAVEMRRNGPAGGRWLRDEGAQRASTALFDDIVVAGTNDAVVEEFAPYLAFNALPREMSPGLHVFVMDPLVGGMKRWVELEAEERVAPLRESIRQARAARDDAPVLDPDTLLSYVEQTVLRLAAYLPDLRELEFALRAVDDGLSIRVSAGTAEGSPLRAAVESAPVGPPSALLGFRSDTALGIYSPGPAPGGASLIDVISSLAGGPLSGDDRAMFETALDAFASSRDGASMVGVGAGIDGPWFAFSQATGSALNLAEVSPAFSHPLVRRIGAHVSGCESWPEAVAITTENAVPLCNETSVSAAQSEGAFSLAIGRAPQLVSNTFSQSLLLPTNGTLTTFPDVARQAEGDAEVIVGVVLTPARVIPALKLFGPFRDSTQTTSTTTVAPIVITLARTDNAGLALESTVSVRALTHLTELIRQFSM